MNDLTTRYVSNVRNSICVCLCYSSIGDGYHIIEWYWRQWADHAHEVGQGNILTAGSKSCHKKANTGVIRNTSPLYIPRFISMVRRLDKFCTSLYKRSENQKSRPVLNRQAHKTIARTTPLQCRQKRRQNLLHVERVLKNTE